MSGGKSRINSFVIENVKAQPHMVTTTQGKEM